MAADERWYFTREQLANSPSRKCGVDADKELRDRQQAANFIQDMGQRLVVSQLCINTAIVYMHRFYVFHSLTQFHRNAIAVAALFLAAKVEEQPRKLEHVIKMAYMCLHRDQPVPDTRSEQFLEQAQDLVFNENVLLQTLGFDVAIDHPHTHVVRCCQLVKELPCPYENERKWNLSVLASKDLAQTSYFMASNSLHLTTMCLQYKPTVVACFCIHLACKWSNWEIPQSTEGRQWFWYVDKTVTKDLLQELTTEFLHIFDKCPSRLKRKILSISASQSPSTHHPSLPSPFDAEPRRIQSSPPLDGTVAAAVAHFSRSHHVPESSAVAHSSRSHHSGEGIASTSAAVAAHSSRSHHVVDGIASTSTTAVTAHSSRSHHTLQEKQDEKKTGTVAGSSRGTAIDYREYREKKERERLEREKAAAAIGSHITDSNKPHSHHHKPVSSTPSIPSKHQILSVQKGIGLHHNHHHRPDMKVSQPVPQRHSTGSQPNRDPSKQRLSREHNTGMTGANAGIAHSHSHANLDSSSSESLSHRSDSSAVQNSTSLTHSSLQEKMSNNNNHTGHRLNALDNKHQAHDKRLYLGEDPRLKSAKYADMNRIENQRRKTETLEQRCEEVRKLIEKPLPPPKQADIPYLINAQQKQQTHHAKYNQQQDKGSSLASDMKHLAIANQNALPQGMSPSALSSQKSAPVKTQMYREHAQGVSQILKDIIKNENSQSSLSTLNNMDDIKSEKRSRSMAHEEFAERNATDVQQSNLHTPPGKHRSLFSPETPITRELHTTSVRPKSKQKTPPSAATKIKQERASPNTQDSLMAKRPSNDGAHKRTRTSSISESEQLLKKEIKTEPDATSLEAMKMLGRVPDLIQPLRDNPSSNGRTVDSQLPTQQMHQEQLQHQQQQHQLQSVQHPLMDHQLRVTQCLSIASDSFTPIASTVDISVLSDNVSMTLPSNMVELPVPVVSTVTTAPPIEEKKSEHHKSEKKKKKHKHKDKEKSKEKHKHKHKDKDKEKHREKKNKEKSEETPVTAPIKITIPKDKLNLGTEASPTVIGGSTSSSDKNISPQSTGLKIKIPKERLKGTDNVPSSSPAQPSVVQGPLKIKIRTDLGISRSSATPTTLLSASNGSSSIHMLSESSTNETSRKRERIEIMGENTSSGSFPPTKKQALMVPATSYGQGHRPGERQNGRHYNSGSNNKVRGRGVRQHPGGRGPPPHHAVAGQRGNVGSHYQREIYGNGRGSRGSQHQQSYSHYPPVAHGSIGGYGRGTGHAEQGTDSYFYANYSTSMFNASAAGYMYDPTYQQYYQPQSQYSLPWESSMLPNLYQNQNMIQSAMSARQEDAGGQLVVPPPPLEPPPSPPPLPSGPPPSAPPPPPPPPSMSE
ncbi:cyclin-T isoform X2 [Monomorium pharaonis]|uniref:cyclin-T isoform X2 n=1 Tax=Monomorium pharaonis TaxID=307658 RepID=UPI00174707BE|nr:cyclin-T isoform X2 [Monomorium pharaonis]